MQAVTTVNTPNNTKNFFPVGDGWVMKKVAMKASTAMVDGSAIGVEVVSNTTTGNATLMPATNASGGNFIGILAERIASTDADYATAGKLKDVLVPTNINIATAKFTVGAGTFTAVDVNKVVSFHSDSKSLAVDTQGAGAIITSYIDSTTGTCVFDVAKTVTA